MKIEVSEEKNVSVVAVGEEITTENFRDFSAVLDQLMDEGVLDVIVDVANVGYITSRGLGAIVGTYTVLKRRGGNLVVAGASDDVLRAMGITKLDKVLTMAPTRAVALQILSASGETEETPPPPPAAT